MNEIVWYGALLAGLMFVVNGVRWRRDGGTDLIAPGVLIALVGASGLIGPKSTPVMLVVFVVLVIWMAVSFFSRSAEARARVRVEFWLAFAVFAAVGALVILSFADIRGTPLRLATGALGLSGAAFIIVTLTRLAMAVRADRHM